jgi:hypothetical protein
MEVTSKVPSHGVSFFTDPLLPQYFYVPEEYMADERAEPTTQGRIASEVKIFKHFFHFV